MLRRRGTCASHRARPFRSRTVAKRFRYGVQVSGRRNRNSDYPPSLASAELMFGKRDDTSDRVRLRTREDRAANTKCAPRMSHSVFRHRLVAMLCSYNNTPTPSLSLFSSRYNEKNCFSLDRRVIANDRASLPPPLLLYALFFSSLFFRLTTNKASTTNTVTANTPPCFRSLFAATNSSTEPQ